MEALKIAIKKECTYCNSKNVEDTMFRLTTGNNYEALDRNLKANFICNKCGRTFRINEKNINMNLK